VIFIDQYGPCDVVTHVVIFFNEDQDMAEQMQIQQSLIEFLGQPDNAYVTIMANCPQWYHCLFFHTYLLYILRSMIAKSDCLYFSKLAYFFMGIQISTTSLSFAGVETSLV